MAHFRGKGTTLRMSATADSGEVTIAQVKSVTPPGMVMGTVETTDLASTARTFISTILDGGTMSFLCNWDPDAASHDTTIWTVFQAGTVYEFEIELPNNAAGSGTKKFLNFSGIVTNFDPGTGGVTVDGLYELSITVKVSGTPTIASS